MNYNAKYLYERRGLKESQLSLKKNKTKLESEEQMKPKE